MKEFSENMGAVVMAMFVSITALFVFFFWYHLDQEKSLPIENRIAVAYCEKLKPLSAEAQVNCENGVLLDILNKFETFELCQQENEDGRKIWLQSDWSDCYTRRAIVLRRTK